MLRIGFVGAGFVGQIGHLRYYDRVDGCEVVALAERRDRLRERVAVRYGIERSYETPTDLFEGSAVDAVHALETVAEWRDTGAVGALEPIRAKFITAGGSERVCRPVVS